MPRPPRPVRLAAPNPGTSLGLTTPVGSSSVTVAFGSANLIYSSSIVCVVALRRPPSAEGPPPSPCRSAPGTIAAELERPALVDVGVLAHVWSATDLIRSDSDPASDFAQRGAVQPRVCIERVLAK